MHEHLSLPEYIGNLNKRKGTPGGGYTFPDNRIKGNYYNRLDKNAAEISKSFSELKEKYNGKIDPNLIYRISVNQSVDYKSIERTFNAMGGITILSVAENRKGYWVVFSNDTELASFRDKLAQYSGIKEGNKYEFFHAIDSVEDIPIEEKLGNNLYYNSLNKDEVEYLDIELWRMDDEYVDKFIRELKETYNDWETFRICDTLITNSFVLLRVKVSESILNAIIQFKEIARVDRPFVPTFKIADYSGVDIDKLEILAPDDNATGVLVIDSGITSNHPLLEKAVGDEEDFQEIERMSQDNVGHGTAVSGVSIYGNIKHKVEERFMKASNWLFSAKVMYGSEDLRGNLIPEYDNEKLFENQFAEAIYTFLDNEGYNIKVVNISLGNSYESIKGKDNRQFPLAALIDELAFEYKDVVFIVSTGNRDPRDIYEELEDIIEQYPNYLVDNDIFRIINPATSALSLTVGSIAPEITISEKSLENHHSQINTPIAKLNNPSPFTRAGLGINNMVKPELVHYGGNLILREEFGYIIEDVGGKVLLPSNNPIDKLFKYDLGTSYSAPMVTHILGKIANEFPNKSANYLKNLLLQSTDEVKVDGFNGTESEKRNSSLKTQGYGLPNFEKAISSLDNRVVLLNEGMIGLNKVQTYSLEFPELFFSTAGYKKISIALTFDPLTRMTRGDSYIGNQMEFKLYHSVDTHIVAQKFAEFDFTDNEVQIEELKEYEIKLLPGTTIRNKGCHQKATKEFKREPQKAHKSPLTLVVINSNKWIPDESYMQNYCVSVMMEHSKDINIYTQIRVSIQNRVRIK